jgi:hypothetical protein
MTNKFTWSSRILNNERLSRLKHNMNAHRVGSWITNTNHRQFFDHCVSSRIIVLFEYYNCNKETNHITIA